jgi:hypothetical protein
MLCLQFISRTTVMIPSHSLSVYHNIFLLDYEPVKNENDETKGNVQCLSQLIKTTTMGCPLLILEALQWAARSPIL